MSLMSPAVPSPDTNYPVGTYFLLGLSIHIFISWSKFTSLNRRVLWYRVLRVTDLRFIHQRVLFLVCPLLSVSKIGGLQELRLTLRPTKLVLVAILIIEILCACKGVIAYLDVLGSQLGVLVASINVHFVFKCCSLEVIIFTSLFIPHLILELLLLLLLESKVAGLHWLLKLLLFLLKFLCRQCEHYSLFLLLAAWRTEAVVC